MVAFLPAAASCRRLIIPAADHCYFAYCYCQDCYLILARTFAPAMTQHCGRNSAINRGEPFSRFALRKSSLLLFLLPATLAHQYLIARAGMAAVLLTIGIIRYRGYGNLTDSYNELTTTAKLSKSDSSNNLITLWFLETIVSCLQIVNNSASCRLHGC